MTETPPLPFIAVSGAGPHHEALQLLLSQQDGVITRKQVLTLGFTPNHLRTWTRRNWQIVHRGVYVSHTGQLSQRQRFWAAVLGAWPAALSHQSALPSLAPPDQRVHVAVPNPARVRGLEGVVVHEMFDFAERVRWSGSPPRIFPEQVVLDLGRRTRDVYDTVGLFASAVGQRLTTVPRLRQATDGRLRVRHRAFVSRVLTDIELGINSTMEYAYATLVEDAHGLPIALRQVRVHGSAVRYRDVEYPRLGVVVELDGWQTHHQRSQREQDLQRDLETRAVAGLETIRLSWRQVTRDRCATAALLGQLLQHHGWSGTAQRCPDCPPEVAVTPLRAT